MVNKWGILRISILYFCAYLNMLNIVVISEVISFDGSTTIEEFHLRFAHEIGCRDSMNGFCLYSDDPIEKDLEHYLDPEAKICDVISKWETALREKGLGKFENSRVIQLTYKNRLYWKHSAKLETEKEKLLLCYQTNSQIVHGRFPLSRELALELASLMSQIDMGEYSQEKSKTSGKSNECLVALDKFYPYRYRESLNSSQIKDLQDLIVSKWKSLKGKSIQDCVRIYLTCCRKWAFFGASLFQATPKYVDQAMIWLAVSEDALSVLELSSMIPIARYPFTSVITFGGCQEDFMIVIGPDNITNNAYVEQKLLFAMSKPKILEITLLIADYMNVLGHTLPSTPKMNTLTNNNSARNFKSKNLQFIGNFSCTNTSTANSTLNYQSNLFNNTAYSSSVSQFVAVNINSQNLQIGQPDILKSTPDHQHYK